MQHIKKIIFVLVALALAAVTILFILENQTNIAIKFMTWKSPELPMATFLIMALLLGLILGALLGWLGITRMRMVSSRLRKQLLKAQKDLKQVQQGEEHVHEGQVIQAKAAN